MGIEICGYYEIRSSFLTNCYSYLRNKVLTRSAWIENETAGGFAYDQMDGAYFEDIERLMIEVVALVVDVGRSTASTHDFHFKRASQILACIGVDGLTQHLEGDELSELRYDLQLIGLLPLQ